MKNLNKKGKNYKGIMAHDAKKAKTLNIDLRDKM